MKVRAFVLGKAYKRYVLGTLTFVFTLNSLDRVLVNLLSQPIKDDLQLSDTQLGFLTGIAFGLFYATLGLPIARWADRGNRVTLVSIAIGLWGGTVMLCVFATTFVQLLAARIAAAIGESGCMPPTYSLLGDYFPAPSERGRAMTIYWLASPLAGLTSFIAGGWLNELYGWRVTFFVMGIPGLLFAVLVKMTIIEPRVRARPDGLSQPQPPRIIDIVCILWERRSCRHLSVAIVLVYVMALGLGPWYAAFMIRSHGMGTAELGLWLGLIFGIGGLAGTGLGGYAAAHWFADNERGQMRLSAVMTAALVPCFIVFLLVPHKEQALMALAPLMVVFCFFLGPTFALLQRLVEDEMRATTLAVVMLFANLIGMGAGPQVVGILSDLLRPAVGTDSLRYAMLAMSLVAFWAAYHFWVTGSTVGEDLSVIAGRKPCGTDLTRFQPEIPTPVP
jgi:MFS family permease